MEQERSSLCTQKPDSRSGPEHVDSSYPLFIQDPFLTLDYPSSYASSRMEQSPSSEALSCLFPKVQKPSSPGLELRTDIHGCGSCSCDRYRHLLSQLVPTVCRVGRSCNLDDETNNSVHPFSSYKRTYIHTYTHTHNCNFTGLLSLRRSECPQCYCGEIREMLTFYYQSFFHKAGLIIWHADLSW
jgi:hypothetical protein